MEPTPEQIVRPVGHYRPQLPDTLQFDDPEEVSYLYDHTDMNIRDIRRQQRARLKRLSDIAANKILNSANKK